jgi:histidinol-phosphate aminotransferase
MSLPFPLNPALDQLPVYQPGRPIEEVARELGLPAADIIKLASNENPLGPSPLALEAMQRAARDSHFYPDGGAFHLKRKLAEKLGVEPRHLIFGNGSNEIIEFVGHALLGPGTDIVVSQYCFAIYPIVARLFSAEVRVVPARNYGHDIPAMLRAVTSRTRAIFVANPNNPTGTLAPRADLVQLVNEAPPGVLVVMDEAYFEFLEDPVDFLPLIRLNDRPNLLLMRTFSKVFGLAGLRVGYGIGHPEFIAALEKIRQPFNINSLAQAGAMAALDDKDHLAKTRSINASGLDFLQNEFRQLDLEYVRSAANFVLVRVGNGQRIFEALQKEGVITRPMGGYQLPEWIRVSVGTPAENSRLLSALKKVLEKTT